MALTKRASARDRPAVTRLRLMGSRPTIELVRCPPRDGDLWALPGGRRASRDVIEAICTRQGWSILERVVGVAEEPR